MRVFIKQISKFLIVGVSAVLVDMVVYYSLSGVFPEETGRINMGSKLFIITGVMIAKAIGFISGSVFTYYFNKIWTWRHKEKTNKTLLYKFGVIYGISFICNTLINQLSLNAIPDFTFTSLINYADGNSTPLLSFKGDKFLAFFFATVFSALFNFVGQRLWIFKQPANITLSVVEED
ncbi:MAG: GtrA family protein [Bacteroidia bacterium]|nr:GtrA family protein [Bacteroidia bacterium]